MIAPARELVDVLFATLWQGACIAIAVTLVLLVAGRRLNAATRSVVLQGALIAIATVPLATTIPNITPHAWVQSGHASVGSSAPTVAATGGLSTLPHRIDVALGDRAVFVLTAAWLIGVLLLTLRIVAGSLQLARLIRGSRRLFDRAGVGVLASRDIGVPLAIGFIRRAVIVPTGLAAGAGDEFDCIVAHELAHVRRGDAYMNACERVLHAFLFFNPAVLLVLRAIALEREAACDDWAIAQSRDLDTYTRSLASFAVRGARTGSVAACGASGFARATLTRIKRLEDARRNGAITLSHYALGGFTLMLALIAFTLQSFAPAVAFGAQSPSHVTVVAASCHDSGARYKDGPAPKIPKGLPNGLKADVRVEVSSSGKVTGAAISKSSGNAMFDQAALTSAKNGTYTPATQNCQPVTGSYTFEAVTSSS